MSDRMQPLVLTRRSFLAASAVAGATAFLSACSPGSATSATTGTLKFWNMPWGNATVFPAADQALVEGFTPASGFGAASYQTVQWASFTQTFATGIASNTGPAVSGGSGTQPFVYEADGKVAYADNLIESWKSSGLYDDFQPGLIDTLKTAEGYAAVPYMVDMRVLWMNSALMEQAGATEPTDWQSYLDACEALKAIDVYGFGTAGGSPLGGQVITGLMLNNGGGLFDEDQQPNLVTDANIEAVEFVLEMVSKGYVDPASISYTSDNFRAQWAARRFGMGFGLPLLGGNIDLTSAAAAELKLGKPLTSPSGEQGATIFVAPIIMYTNTPSQENSEAFVTYYFENLAQLWTEPDSGIGLLPVLKSIVETPEFQADAMAVEVVENWLPVGKALGNPGSNTTFLNCAAADGTPALVSFAQSVLGGQTDARTALQDFETALKSTLPSS